MRVGHGIVFNSEYSPFQLGDALTEVQEQVRWKAGALVISIRQLIWEGEKEVKSEAQEVLRTPTELFQAGIFITSHSPLIYRNVKWRHFYLHYYRKKSSYIWVQYEWKCEIRWEEAVHVQSNVVRSTELDLISHCGQQQQPQLWLNTGKIW